MKKLMIVESPIKSAKLKSLLGKQWSVVASMGHIEDLPENTIGVFFREDGSIDVQYVLNSKKKENLKKIIEESKRCDEIYIATDPDREGEAIAYQIRKYLPADKPVYRVTFNALTYDTIMKSISERRQIDMNLVNAQMARRIIDRIIGYILSPLATQKYGIPISVGRVQSPVVAMIREREIEIKNFIPEIKWNIEAVCYPIYFAGINMPFTVKHVNTFNSYQSAKDVINKISNKFTVLDVKKAKTFIKPYSPLTTAKLQIEAFRRYGFPVGKTMKIAQRLYERGFCTYVRTDSPYISDEGYKLAEEYINRHYGKEMFQPRQYKAEGLAQESHECIRPTMLSYSKEKLNDDERKILQLISEYFYSSQMPDAVVESTTVTLSNNSEIFKTEGRSIVKEGFLKHLRSYESLLREIKVPFLSPGQVVVGNSYIQKTKTSPPNLYNESDVIEKMKHFGIGRPSTYASVIESIRKRKYVRGNKGLKTTVYADYLLNFLSDRRYSFVLDLNFTKMLEEKLDEIAKGNLKKEEVINEVYDRLRPLNKKGILLSRKMAMT